MAQQKHADRLIDAVGTDRDHHCTVCYAHVSDPHSPDCPANQDGEEGVWLSRATIHDLIDNFAEANDATAHEGAEWGDRNADADAVTAPGMHGIVTVAYDNVATAVAHGDRWVSVYAYPMPRPRRADEDLVEYATTAMCDEDGANRTPVEIVERSLFQAIASAIDSLSLKTAAQKILGDDFTVAENPHSDFPSVEIDTFAGSAMEYVGFDPETGKYQATQWVIGPCGEGREDTAFETLTEAVEHARKGTTHRG
jgi:hypothetical protein